jgi:UDPglucose--hexose-1-phosphate uridylyltransferase
MPDLPDQELRQDLITKRWVIVAPKRDQRPRDIDDAEAGDPRDASPVEGCPFCPGHEDMLTRVVWQMDDAEYGPAGWRTRAVPNKYPALTPDPAPHAERCGLYRSKAGIGRQEVVIDTPYHYESLAHMPVAQVEAVLETYLERYRTLREESRANGTPLIPFIFRNHGADAGASLPHPHSQIIAAEIEPPRVKQEERRAQAHYAETGRCAYCEMIEDELDAEARLVHATDSFVAFVPYSAQAPFETWILPREHEPEFGRTGPAARSALAESLHAVLSALHTQCGNPAYNFFVRTALAYDAEAPHLHWSLRIRPRISVNAGFELATGLQVNPSLPERDAEVLREGVGG